MKKQDVYKRFIDTYKEVILGLIERGVSAHEFEGQGEEAGEIWKLWGTHIYGLCLNILSSSMTLIYSDNIDVVQSLSESLEKA